MAKLKVAINGFGRIGRLTTRIISEQRNIEVVAINDLFDNHLLAHLFKYDTAHKQFKGRVRATKNSIYINGHKITALSEPDPKKLPWKELGVDIVIDCSGRYRTKALAQLHIDQGAKRVIISAPGDEHTATVVLGVNGNKVNKRNRIYSNASCTTNCLAPMVKVLMDNFGISSGFMSTIHAYTADQNIQDGAHNDYRRARAAAQNIVPTSTGAANALQYVIPEIKGKISGGAIRVPVIDGSLTELYCYLKKSVTVEEINAAFLKAAKGKMKGILSYSTDPIVSSDVIGNPYSTVFDSLLTQSNGRLVKVVGWYDNEYGYSCRMVDLTKEVGKKL